MLCTKSEKTNTENTEPRNGSMTRRQEMMVEDSALVLHHVRMPICKSYLLHAHTGVGGGEGSLLPSFVQVGVQVQVRIHIKGHHCGWVLCLLGG